MKDIIFNVKGITAGYHSENVLSNVNLSVRRGDFLSIIGPNGAGKSTLLKVMAGDVKPKSGELLFLNRPLNRFKSRYLAKKRSVVYQVFENIPPFTVYEFLRMGRFPYQGFYDIESDEDKEIIENIISLTGIENLLNSALTELSSGEFQLVYIAHALVQNNDIILLDEPISHLDIKHSIEIMDLLYRLNEKGATVITVLHEINIASDYSKTICGIKKGEIFFNDSPPKSHRLPKN